MTAAEAARGLGPVPLPAPGAPRRHRGRPAYDAPGTPRSRSPFGVAPTTLQRAAHPEGEVAMARAIAAAGVPDGRLEQRRRDLRGHRRHRRHLLAPGLRHRRPRPPACRSCDRAVGAGRRRVVLTADTPVVGTKYDGDGPSLGARRARTGRAPTSRSGTAAPRATRRPPTSDPQDVELAGPGHRPPGGGQGRAPPRRRPPLCRTPGRPPSGSPTTAAASSTAPPPRPTALRRGAPRRRRRRGGVRRRGSAHCPALVPPCAGRPRGVHGPAAALRAGRRRPRRAWNGFLDELDAELVEALRLARLPLPGPRDACAAAPATALTSRAV